ncbi:target of Nesh-SH3 isoform X1 [Lissotriton helveticus]
MTGRAAHCTAAAVPRVRYSASPSDYRLVIVTMIPRLLCLLFCWDVAVHVGRAQKLPGVKKTSLKVQINATGDTVNLKFLRPSPNIKLEGFILGYGSNFFSTQYIPLPENGKFYDTELDAEPRYLIAVHPSPVVNSKKNCAGQTKVQKPLQVVVGTLTPTSVYLAWGVLVNPQYDWTVLNKCLTDRFYTVRYREKEKNKKWLFHFCPNTETVIDNLKPNVIYEFGVKDNSEDGTWNKGVAHKTTAPPKHKINGGNGHIQNTYSAPKGHIQVAPEDTKMHIPITMIKQVVQNISIPKKDTSVKPPVPPAKIAAIESLPGTKSSALPIVSKNSEAFLVYSESQTEPFESHVAPSPGLSSTLGPSSTDQDTTQPVISNGFQLLATTLAVNDTQQTRAIPGTSEEPVAPQTKTANDEITQQYLTAQIYISSEEPESTLVSNELPIFTIMEKTTTGTEIQIINPETHSEITESSKPITNTPVKQPDPTEAVQGMMPESLKTRTFNPTEKTGPTQAVHQTIQETRTDIPDISPKLPDSTPVSNEPTIFPFKEVTSAAAEIQELKPASTRQNIPETITPKSSRSEEQPKATLAFQETPFSSSEPKDVEIPEIPPTNPVYWTSPTPATTKPTRAPQRPSKATHGPKEPSFIPFKYTTSVRPHRPQSTLVPKSTHRMPINLIRLHIFEDPKFSLVPNETQKSSFKPTSQTTEISHAKAASKEQYIDSIEPTLSVPHQKLETTHVPKSTHRMPINLIRLHIFEDPKMSLVPNETQKSSSKPTSQTTEISHAKAASEELYIDPIEPKLSIPHQKLETTHAPKKVHSSSSRPKSSVRPRTRPASEELFIDPIEPKLSVPHQKLETTHAPKKVHSSSSRPKPSVRPRTRPVPNRTTQATARPKSSNDLNWISETSIGAKLTGQDGTKLLGVSRNTSMEPNGTVKRPASGSSHPGTPRATLTPARPTHMRRRPFYPYNVTGRPRISGNGLVPRAPSSSIRHVPRPTRVPIVERTQTPRTKTTAAPEPPTVTEPVFNTNPVSELDPMGKPRYTAPHVKYMRKEDLVPCSITESMKHFPNELATNVDEATTPPQNSPSNLTVIAVEGCPSFVILDWKEPDNDTVTEYKVISKENGGTSGKDQSILRTNQTHSTVENLKPNTSYEFKVLASNILGEGPPSTTVTHSTESVDPRVSEPITGGKDAIWTEIKFKSDTYSECKGKQYVKRTWYKKFVGIQLCNSLRYKIYLSDSLGGKFYNIGDESGYGEDHCQFVDSFLDGRTGQRLLPEQLPSKEGFYRSVRQQPVEFGKMGSQTHIRYVQWYECGTTIPGKW